MQTKYRCNAITHCRCYTWCKTASPSLPPLMLPRSFTSPKLAQESALLLFYCSIHEILGIIMLAQNLCYYLYSTPPPRFTVSVMLAHESLLLPLHYPVHEIYSIRHTTHESPLLNSYCHINYTHSICHASSQISPAVLALSTRFPASVMLAHESPLQNLTLQYWRDSQHPSSWLMNPCYKTTLPYSRDSRHHHAGSKSLLLTWLCPHHEIHSICCAGS
jgi:hypothetical protein